MATCPSCGQRLALGGARRLRSQARIEKLVTEVQLALREAQKDIPETPPIVRSMLLEVKSMLARLVTDGGGLAADLHESAHDARLHVQAERVREWESTAHEVLSELLAALDRSALPEGPAEDD